MYLAHGRTDVTVRFFVFITKQDKLTHPPVRIQLKVIHIFRFALRQKKRIHTLSIPASWHRPLYGESCLLARNYETAAVHRTNINYTQFGSGSAACRGGGGGGRCGNANNYVGNLTIFSHERKICARQDKSNQLIGNVLNINRIGCATNSSD